MKFLGVPVIVLLAALAAPALGFDFGDDASEWANDGECDDRRFAGPGTSMASGFNAEDRGHDATDCRKALLSGRVYIWAEAEARAATQCSALEFGTDDGDYANDGQCDDPRFEGRGTAPDLVFDDLMRDATDCRRLCAAGKIFLRDYKVGLPNL